MKIQLKRSNTLVDSKAKAPTSEQMDFGELAVNYSDEDPSIFLKKTGGDIVKIGGSNSVGNDLQAVTDAGNTTTNGATFAGVVSCGDSVFLNPANGSLEVYQPDGVIDTTPAVLVQDSGDQFNAIIEGSGTIKIGGDGSFNSVANAPATRLNNDGSAKFAGKVDVGDWSGSAAGVVAAPSGYLHVRKDGGTNAIGVWNGAGNTNTASIHPDGRATFAGQVISGTDSVRGSFKAFSPDGNNGSRCFLIQDPDNSSLNYASINGDGSATFGQENIKLNADGGATFAGSVNSGTGVQGTSGAVQLDPTGRVIVRGASDDNTTAVFSGYGLSSSTVTSSINSDGSASFADRISAGTSVYSQAPNPSAFNFQAKDSAGSAYFSVRSTGAGSGEVLIGGTLTPFAPNISLKRDGSAEFADIVNGGAFHITDSKFTANNDELIRILKDGDRRFVVTSSGSATFAGTVISNGFVNHSGNVLSQNGGFNLSSGKCHIRQDGGNPVFAVYSGGGDASNIVASINGGGSATFASDVQAVNFNSTSDATLKTNINPIDNAIDMIKKITGVTFDWKDTQASSIGVLAQDVETVAPELVANGQHKSVNYNGIVGILVEAVKELSAEVQALKEKN